MNVGSLFSGIGGFDLGLERAGMRTLWFCEQDPYCQRVLARHWPGVPCYPEVRSLVANPAGNGRDEGDANGGRGNEGTGPRSEHRPSGGDEGAGLLPVQVPYVDVLCGGFPCQDLSVAGKGAGITGARSGLWSEYARLIGELRPRYVIVENVPALLARGFERVLGDLAALGYDAEWDCIPASAFGAPHRRDRVWVVAYPSGAGLEGHGGTLGDGAEVSDPRGPGDSEQVADAEGERHERAGAARDGGLGLEDGGGRSGEADVSDPHDQSQSAVSVNAIAGRGLSESAGGHEWWATEPDVGRVANGVPARVDRLRALGNALVPQIAEWIGIRVMAYEERVTA